MNKIFKNIFWKDMRERKAVAPVLNCAQVEHVSFVDNQVIKEKHRLTLNFSMDFWINDVYGGMSNDVVKNDLQMLFIKQLHNEFFGEIEHLVHELQLHVYREEYQDCLDTLKLLKTAIKGE